MFIPVMTNLTELVFSPFLLSLNLFSELLSGSLSLLLVSCVFFSSFLLPLILSFVLSVEL
jgi:hypothetical protein